MCNHFIERKSKKKEKVLRDLRRLVLMLVALWAVVVAVVMLM